MWCCLGQPRVEAPSSAGQLTPGQQVLPVGPGGRQSPRLRVSNPRQPDSAKASNTTTFRTSQNDIKPLNLLAVASGSSLLDEAAPQPPRIPAAKQGSFQHRDTGGSPSQGVVKPNPKLAPLTLGNTPSAPRTPGYQVVHVTRAEMVVSNSSPDLQAFGGETPPTKTASPREPAWRPSSRGIHPEPTSAHHTSTHPTRMSSNGVPGPAASQVAITAAQPEAALSAAQAAAEAQVEAMWQPPRRPIGSAADADGQTYITSSYRPGQLITRQASDTSYFKGSSAGRSYKSPAWLEVLASTVSGKKTSYTDGSSVGLSSRSREVSGGVPGRLSDAYKQRVVSARSTSGGPGESRAASATGSENGVHTAVLSYLPTTSLSTSGGGGVRLRGKPSVDGTDAPTTASDKRSSRRSPGPGAAGFLHGLIPAAAPVSGGVGPTAGVSTNTKEALLATRQALGAVEAGSGQAVSTYRPGMLSRLNQQNATSSDGTATGT